jgi:hypothetical protein
MRRAPVLLGLLIGSIAFGPGLPTMNQESAASRALTRPWQSLSPRSRWGPI